MSVIDLVPPPPDRSSAASTRARLSSLDFIAAIAAGAPGAVLCSVSSGSLSQSNENCGMPFSQRKSVSAFVVHASRSAGCIAGGNAPSVFTISVMASGGAESPAKIFCPLRGSACRSNKSPTVLAVAIAVLPPPLRINSAIVGRAMYFPTQFVTSANDPRIFDIDGPLRVNLGPVIVISQDAAAIWVNAGVDCSAVNNRGAWKDRVMISKSDTALRQFPERGCALFADDIGPHAIPDHDHHMFVPANRSLGGSILHRRSSAAD